MPVERPPAVSRALRARRTGPFFTAAKHGIYAAIFREEGHALECFIGRRCADCDETFAYVLTGSVYRLHVGWVLGILQGLNQPFCVKSVP